MSWTSESGPPPPRPNSGGAEPADDDDDKQVEAEDFTDRYWADTPTPSEIPDDGPLDPSIFDGLFADLTPQQPEQEPPPESPGDGFQIVSVEEPADELVDELVDAIDLDQLDDPDPEMETDPELEADLETDPELEADLETGSELEADDDRQPVEDQPASPAPPTEPQLPKSDARQPTSTNGDGHTEHNGQQTEHNTQQTEPNRQQADTDGGVDGFDPHATLFEIDQGDQQHAGAAPKVDDANPGHGSMPTVTVDNAETLHAQPPQHPKELPQVSVDQPAFDHGAPIAEHDRAPATGGSFEAGPAFTQPDSNRGPGSDRSQPRSRWRAFAVATAIGAALGIGGAFALSQLVGRSEQNQASTPSGDSQAEQPSGQQDPVTQAATDGGTATPTEAVSMPTTAELTTAGRFELNGLRFEPGTLTLTEEAQSALEVAGSAAMERPGSSLAIVVRTYSEQTPAANLDLSTSQAQALVDGLIGLGVAPDAISATGIGASLLDPAQPVPNFVVVGAGLRSSTFKSAVAELNPFAIGIDPATNRLRPESMSHLDRLGRAMAADPDATVSLAAYANTGPDETTNRSRAAVAAEAAAAYLVSNHAVEPTRIGLLTPGQALYVVPAETGNHISLRWGADGGNPAAVSEADQLSISFPAGSVTIGQGAADALDRVAATAERTGTSFVINLHTGTESSTGANEQLGTRQAAAVADHLTRAGVTEDQIRVYGGGELRQFEQGPGSRAVITPLP